MLDDHGWSWMIFFVGGETWKHWIFSRGRGSGRSMTGSNGQVLHWDQPGPVESSIMELFFSNFCSVLFCSVLFCSVLWRSMMTLHMTFFFSPSPCHRTGPIGQTQKAIIEARLSAAASCGAPVDGPVLSWPLKPLQLEKHPSHLLPWPDLTLPEKKSLTKPLDTRRPLSQFRAKWQWWLKFSLSNKKLNYGANVKMSCQPEHTKLHKKAL